MLLFPTDAIQIQEAHPPSQDPSVTLPAPPPSPTPGDSLPAPPPSPTPTVSLPAPPPSPTPRDSLRAPPLAFADSIVLGTRYHEPTATGMYNIY